VALHGCTQTSSDFAAGSEFDELAERNGMVVLYPQQSMLANPRRCWNWYLPKNQRRETGEVAAVLALIEDIRRQYAIDGERIFVAGLSAGAALAAILAEQAPDVFAAAGIAAGVPLHAAHDVASARTVMAGLDEPPIVLPPARSRKFRRLRVSIWTGGKDKVVAPVNARALATQFSALIGTNGRPFETEERPFGMIARQRDARGIVRIELWTVDEMGHAWSGGSFRGSHTYPDGPSMSAALMQFFLEPPVRPTGLRQFLPAKRPARG